MGGGGGERRKRKSKLRERKVELSSNEGELRLE